MGNPRSRVLLPCARFDNVRPMGEGRHASFSVSSGGARARAVAFGCDGRVPGSATGERLDATFRLERNVWNGAIEPRLLLCSARPCEAGQIEVLGEPEDYLGAVLADLEREVAPAPPPAGARTPLGVVERPPTPDSRPARPPRREPAGHSPRRPVRRRRGARSVRRRSPAPWRPRGPDRRLHADVLRRPRARPRSGRRLPSARRARSALVVPQPRRPCATVRGSCIWPGASLSYALQSRCMSWSTVSALRSSLSIGA